MRSVSRNRHLRVVTRPLVVTSFLYPVHIYPDSYVVHGKKCHVIIIHQYCYVKTRAHFEVNIYIFLEHFAIHKEKLHTSHQQWKT